MNKLLIFTEYFLPAKKGGGPVSSIRNLVELLHKDYEIGIVCFNHDMNETDPLEGVIANSWNNWNNKAKVFYIGRSEISKTNIDNLILEFSPNTIYLNAIFVYQFILFPIWAAKKINAKVVIASRGMLQAEALNQKRWKKKIYTSLLKLSSGFNKVTWHSTNTNETKDIYRNFNTDNIKMISNVPIVPNNSSQKIGSKNLKLLSISLNTEMKNIHFLLEVLGKIEREITYHIYGPIKDEDYWNKCLAIIETLPSNIKVEYKGEIDPDKIGDILPKYNLFVLPTLGENFGHAIFEALANGVPTLISDRTPWRNLEEKNIGFDLALNKNIWIEKINSFDIEKLNNMRIDANSFAKKYFENGNFKNEYLRLFN